MDFPIVNLKTNTFSLANFLIYNVLPFKIIILLFGFI